MAHQIAAKIDRNYALRKGHPVIDLTAGGVVGACFLFIPLVVILQLENIAQFTFWLVLYSLLFIASAVLLAYILKNEALFVYRFKTFYYSLDKSGYSDAVYTVAGIFVGMINFVFFYLLFVAIAGEDGFYLKDNAYIYFFMLFLGLAFIWGMVRVYALVLVQVKTIYLTLFKSTATEIDRYIESIEWEYCTLLEIKEVTVYLNNKLIEKGDPNKLLIKLASVHGITGVRLFTIGKGHVVLVSLEKIDAVEKKVELFKSKLTTGVPFNKGQIKAIFTTRCINAGNNEPFNEF